MKTATISSMCDICGKTFASTIFKWECYQDMPHLPRFSGIGRGIDLCHDCETEVKASLDKLRREKLNARTP